MAIQSIAMGWQLFSDLFLHRTAPCTALQFSDSTALWAAVSHAMLQTSRPVRWAP
jgi:hypothetical protein